MILVPVGLGPKFNPGDVTKRSGLVQNWPQKGNSLRLTIKLGHILNIKIFLERLINVLGQAVSYAHFCPGVLSVEGLSSVQQKPAHLTNIQEDGRLSVLEITPECVHGELLPDHETSPTLKMEGVTGKTRIWHSFWLRTRGVMAPLWNYIGRG